MPDNPQIGRRRRLEELGAQPTAFGVSPENTELANRAAIELAGAGGNKPNPAGVHIFNLTSQLNNRGPASIVDLLRYLLTATDATPGEAMDMSGMMRHSDVNLPPTRRRRLDK